MQKKYKMFALVGLLLLGTGCTSGRTVRLDSMQEVLRKQGGSVNRNMANNLSQVSHDVWGDNHAEKEDRVSRLERHLEEMRSVETASVVLIENAAIVSVNFKGDVKPSELTELKKEVKQNVRAFDKALRYVSVTASPEIMDKLYDITEEGTREQMNTTPLGRYKPQV